jgi:hypothetical protein
MKQQHIRTFRATMTGSSIQPCIPAVEISQRDARLFCNRSIVVSALDKLEPFTATRHTYLNRRWGYDNASGIGRRGNDKGFHCS